MSEVPEQAGPQIEVTRSMIEAGVSAIYREMGYQLAGSVEDGVAAVIEAALRELSTAWTAAIRSA